jgi:penicillin-binding protein 1B
LSVRVHVPRKIALSRVLLSPVGKAVLIGSAALLIVFFSVVAYFYSKYARLTDEGLTRGPFPNASLLYASAEPVMVGDAGSPSEIAVRLRHSGYSEDARGNRVGWFHLRPDAIEIFPGPDSYFDAEAGVIKFNNDKVADIISLRDNSARTEYDLEPELLSNLFDKSREKRRMVRFSDIPPLLVHAVISAEDKRFFQHSGFDPFRIVKAFIVDLREMRRAEGASTITQQLARNLWLNSQKTYSRKIAELMITVHLEKKLTKQQIFEFYANQVDLGRRGSFGIRGFGEASQAYFGKDISQLTLPEAATLAGLIQRPSYRNPARWPDRAKARRNVVLLMMKDNGYITQGQYEAACAAPLVITKPGIESSGAPYFVDLVNQQLLDRFQDRDFNDTGYRVYTTIDLDLQRDAMDAVAQGYKEVEAAVLKRHKKGTPVVLPQVALVALDPHTGEVKALVGGTNYGVSQLNHAVAKRPSGSIFKPFVYAAALSRALYDTNGTPITQSTTILDEPRAFYYQGEPYEPSNYEGKFYGDVTLRTALAKSLNIPTIELAESIGYGTVADLAHKAGLTDVRATPAMALGAYDVTPLDMAGAYTIFANKGNYVQPHFVDWIRDSSGTDVYKLQPDEKKVLDPRVDYLMINLMQEVLRSGTGAGVRARGFKLPAAGKTGTSHDGWFAGFTTKLLCVVWVGYDDYRDLKLEGAHSALPIWTDFMKRAHTHRAYRTVNEFDVPDGVVSVQIDSQTGELATPSCPDVRNAYYLAGTQPTQFCHLHGGATTQIAGWDTAPVTPNLAPPGHVYTPPLVPGQPLPPPRPNAGSPEAQQGQEQPPQPEDQQQQKKKGFFDKLKGIFK